MNKIEQIAKLSAELEDARRDKDSVFAKTRPHIESRERAEEKVRKLEQELEAAKNSVLTWYTAEGIDYETHNTTTLAVWALLSTPMRDKDRERRIRACCQRYELNRTAYFGSYCVAPTTHAELTTISTHAGMCSVGCINLVGLNYHMR